MATDALPAEQPSFATVLRAPFQPGVALPALATSKSKLWVLGALLVTALIAIPAAFSAQLTMSRMFSSAAPVSPPGLEINPSAPPPNAAPPPEMIPGPGAAPASGLLSISGLIAIATGALSVWIGWLLHALLAFFGGVLIGGRATFGGVFKTIALAATPLALRGVVQSIYLAVSGQPLGAPGMSGLVMPQMPALISAAASAAPGAGPSPGTLLLGSLLGSIDVFQIWALIALALGLAALTKLKKGSAFALALITMLLLAMLFALPGVIGAIASAPAI
jgi:hypothetical protein